MNQQTLEVRGEHVQLLGIDVVASFALKYVGREESLADFHCFEIILKNEEGVKQSKCWEENTANAASTLRTTHE